MAINQTGNAEIDQQHELLDHMVEQLADFCSEAEKVAEPACSHCPALKSRHCSNTLAAITSELMAFLQGHAVYEEKMMDLLPATPSCQAHIKAHKAAHEGISRQLQKLTLRISTLPPLGLSAEIMQVAGGWLSDHSALFDSRLVHLGKADAPKVDLDGELVTMLDQHVFPNRPTRGRLGERARLALQGRKQEVRSRFESLSPAQRAVFWLVIGGKTTREIGSTLAVSVNTVKTHRSVIFQKMDVKSILELVKKADVLR